MLGIFKGLKITIKHFFSSKLTRMYPFEKRQLPERSRGLIQLVVEKETGQFKCEACLLCEKVCPPRAISIEYSKRDPHRPFRRRPPLRPGSISGYYRPRLVSAAPYEGERPVSYAVAVPRDEVAPADAGDAARLEAILAAPRAEDGLLTVLDDVQAAFGYLPRWALERVAGEAGLPISELYSMVSLSPRLRLSPAGTGGDNGSN